MSRVRFGLLGIVAVILGGLVVPSVLAQFPPVPPRVPSPPGGGGGGVGPNMGRPQGVWVCQGCRKEIGTGAFPPDTCPFCKVKIINGVGKGGDHPFQPDGGGLNQPNPGGIAPPVAPSPRPIGPGGGFTPPGGGAVPPAPPQPQPFTPSVPPNGFVPPNGRQSGVQPQPFGQPPQQYQPQDGTGGQQQGVQPQPPGLAPVRVNPGGDFNQPNGWQPANVPQPAGEQAQPGSTTPPPTLSSQTANGLKQMQTGMLTGLAVVGTIFLLAILAIVVSLVMWYRFAQRISKSRRVRVTYDGRRLGVEGRGRRRTVDDDDDDDDDDDRPRKKRRRR